MNKMCQVFLIFRNITNMNTDECDHNLDFYRGLRCKRGLPIGKGGYFTAYCCTRDDNQSYVVKMPHCQSEVTSRCFENEVLAYKKLLRHRHPNLPTMLASCRQDCTLVIEYYPKYTEMYNLVEVESVPVLLQFMKQLLDVLIYLNDQVKLSHLDVKFENILIVNGGDGSDGSNSSSPVLKLIDFGNARSHGNIELTENTLFGTVIYSAPELMLIEDTYQTQEDHSFAAIDGKQDVFSCGVLLYTLLTKTLMLHCPEYGINRMLRAKSLYEDMRSHRWRWYESAKVTSMSEADSSDKAHIESLFDYYKPVIEKCTELCSEERCTLQELRDLIVE